MSESLLEVKNLEVHYGGICALKQLNMHVMPGESVSLVGANGAGKSSTLNAICGLVRHSAGSIYFDGIPMDQMAAHTRQRLGLAMVPEGRALFERMSVWENLKCGAHHRTDHSVVEEEMETLLQWFPQLRSKLKQSAGLMSGGEKQMIAIGRALLSSPRLLILDEPSMGLAPQMVDIIFEIIDMIHQKGTSLLIVEQNARLALQLTARTYLLMGGVLEHSGPSSSFYEDYRLIDAYLGHAPK